MDKFDSSVAENDFINTVATTANITVDEARKIFDYYKSHGLIKLDAFGKVYATKHHEFWDKDTILWFVGSYKIIT